MMQIAFENNPKKFLSKHGGYLHQYEAEHNLILSLCQAAEQKIARGENCDIRFATLSNDEGIILATAQTPPHNLVLSRATQQDVQPLAEMLAKQHTHFPGIVGPSDIAASFAETWGSLTGQKSVEYMDQIIYSLTKVLMPPPIQGLMRAAKPGEAPLIAGWIRSFAADALPKSEQLSEADALKKAEDVIKAGRMAVWDIGGRPVAQAAVSGTENVARISMVYTPPEERGHGYAKAVVAHLSQQQLDAGKTMCCLYADARNPVSNSIYRKIGYEFVGRSSLYVLDKQAAK
ncbi:MAG: GNAT family N-acetyltransferase [Alphaproteobacteria bacterium]|nr:MAG: GNAT family N-acetyltransferase [Alphaproteobacteria bacterium]